MTQLYLISYAFIFLHLISAVAGLKASNRQTALRAHNQFRRDLANGRVKNKDGSMLPGAKNMYEFKYNLVLERIAKRSASLCQFKHSEPKSRNFTGETIYLFTKLVKIDTVLKDAAVFWWQELDDYGIDSSLNLTRPEFEKGIGHFTQMAWGSTTSVGCAVRYCHSNKSNRAKFTIVFCNYFPAGNILNNFIYEAGEPCKTHSDCTRYKDSKCLGEKRGRLCRRS